jgi:hypothetical protein
MAVDIFRMPVGIRFHAVEGPVFAAEPAAALGATFYAEGKLLKMEREKMRRHGARRRIR